MNTCIFIVVVYLARVNAQDELISSKIVFNFPHTPLPWFRPLLFTIDHFMYDMLLTFEIYGNQVPKSWVCSLFVFLWLILFSFVEF